MTTTGHTLENRKQVLEMSSPSRETTQQEQKQVTENEFPWQGKLHSRNKHRFLKMSSPGRGEYTNTHTKHIKHAYKTYQTRISNTHHTQGRTKYLRIHEHAYKHIKHAYKCSRDA